MTHRENVEAILHYRPYERMPVVSFGYWKETLYKWVGKGHITRDEADGYKANGDNSEADRSVMRRLGFDFNWNSCIGIKNGLFPPFEHKLLEKKPDGTELCINGEGLIVQIKPGTVSIPSEVGTSLTDRKAWKEQYLPRLLWSEQRINPGKFSVLANKGEREIPVGLHCGSLIGTMRNLLGIEGLSYLYADDPDLYVEIINTFGELSYRGVEAALKTGVEFDYAHYWEDICFKNGPLVVPGVFAQYVGPHYKRTSQLLNAHGVDIISVDCDGCIDSLVPIWLENGVNTMFPIEVGTWDASIAPWREKYGKTLRGVGGVNKTVFSRDYAAIDREVERLKGLIALGGYIPCPDHRIAPDAIFENVQYYCEQMQRISSCKYSQN